MRRRRGRTQPPRPGLRVRRRLPERLLRRRRLLQQRVHGDVQDLQRPGAPGICTFVPSGVPEHVGRLPGSAPCRPAGSTARCDGAGALPQVPRGHRLQAGHVHRAPPSATSTSATARAAASRVRRRSAPRSTAIPRRTSARRPARPTPTAPAASSASNGSCGPKPSGAVCAKNDDCESGFCADGVCCNVACKGPCVSCDQPGREGNLLARRRGRPDPHNVCAGPGAGDLRHDGRLRRHRRLRALRGRDRLHHAGRARATG